MGAKNKDQPPPQPAIDEEDRPADREPSDLRHDIAAVHGLLAGEHARLKVEHEQLAVRHQDMVRLSADFDAKLKERLDEHDRLVVEIDRLKAKRDSLADEVAKHQVALNQREDRERERLEAAQVQTAEVVEQGNAAERRRLKIEAAVATLAPKRDDLAEEIVRLKGEVDDLEQKRAGFATFEDLLAAKQRHDAELDKEIAVEELTLAGLQRSIQDATAERDTMLAEARTLKQQALELHGEAKKHEGEAHATQGANRATARALEDRARRHDERDTNLTQLETQLRTREAEVERKAKALLDQEASLADREQVLVAAQTAAESAAAQVQQLVDQAERERAAAIAQQNEIGSRAEALKAEEERVALLRSEQDVRAERLAAASTQLEADKVQLARLSREQQGKPEPAEVHQAAEAGKGAPKPATEAGAGAE